MRMSPIDGVELTKRLHEKAPNIDVIVISAHGDIAMAVRAMKAGARDFVEKSEGYETLVRAIRELSPRATDMTVDVEERDETLRRIKTLSPRELEILNLVGAGKTGRQMASELRISARTVEARRRSTMRKMGALRLGHLVRMATVARG